MQAILLLAGLAYLIYKSSIDLSDKLSFEPTGFDLAKKVLSLKILNASESSATVQNVSGSIFSNNNKIGTYQVSEPFKIPAFSAANIQVKLNLDAVATALQVIEVLKSGKTPKISINGKINTSIGGIDFSNTIVEKVNLFTVK